MNKYKRRKKEKVNRNKKFNTNQIKYQKDSHYYLGNQFNSLTPGSTGGGGHSS